MSFSIFCVKCLHFLLNAVYGVLALVFISLGVWAMVSSAVKSLFDDLQFPAAYVLLGIGAVMLITSILADIAVCCLSRALMIVSLIGYVLTLVSFVIAITWLALSRESIKTKLDNLLGNCVSEYKQNGQFCRVFMDSVQSYFGCCGKTSAFDYLPSTPPSSCGLDITSIANGLGCSSKLNAAIDQYFPVIVALFCAQLVVPLGLAILSGALFRLSKSDGFTPVRT